MNKLQRKLLKPLDWLFNRKIKKYILGVEGIYIIGDKGSGKSCLYALAAEESKKQGIDVFSQYPYKDTFVIPVVIEDLGKWRKTHRLMKDGTWKEFKNWIPHYSYNIDKDWLTTRSFKDCTILLDEARTIWPNRNYADWSIGDDEFFNFLRKDNINLFVSSQIHDCIDLNVRRGVNEVWFLWKKSRNSPFTHIEVYQTQTAPIANEQKSIRLSFLKKPMAPMDWDICSSLVKTFIFYRPPYYDLFDTNFYYRHLYDVELNSWNDNPRGIIKNNTGNPELDSFTLGS